MGDLGPVYMPYLAGKTQLYSFDNLTCIGVTTAAVIMCVYSEDDERFL